MMNFVLLLLMCYISILFLFLFRSTLLPNNVCVCVLLLQNNPLCVSTKKKTLDLARVQFFQEVVFSLSLSSCSLSFYLILFSSLSASYLYFSKSIWTIIDDGFVSPLRNTINTHTHERKTQTRSHNSALFVSKHLSILLPYNIYDPVIHLPCPCAYSACLFVATLIAIIIIITEDRFVIYIYFALHRPFSLSPSSLFPLIWYFVGFSVSVFNFFIFSRLVCLCTWQEYI